MKINLHTHQKSKNQHTVDIVNQYPREFDFSASFFSVGIHPWYVDKDEQENELKLIDEYLQQDNALALGECGLDKRTEVPWDLQIAVFEKQLLLAEKHRKPVIVHCVAAFQEVVELKKKNRISVPLIFHGFSKNKQVATMLLKEGCYLSFGKYLLRNPELSEVFKAMPLERIFLETDTMEETIEEVYAKASEIVGLSVLDIEIQINKNAQVVFGFSESLQKVIK
ncbi:TatD family hydrolase [Myroides guanonis]|uniref:TatD DNase family protein n=1 Tax=Myroides guanonis TaxID=1150112 RepID=A0A1I3NHL6_9FLAO|nr:TatD family hydrolase [Myroides guanonis]SFJ08804.1 TatD DNase family protein [Myroides guanonis]